MLALGKLLELTLAGREPTEKIQLTREGEHRDYLSLYSPAQCLQSGPCT